MTQVTSAVAQLPASSLSVTRAEPGKLSV